MMPLWELIQILVAQNIGRQTLERVPEPSQITDAAPNVAQYNRVMMTKLVLAYAIGLQIVHRARSESVGGSAIDLACGPGHYTRCLARYLGFDHAVGVDLSPSMVRIAAENAAAENLANRLHFQCGDATKLDGFKDDQFDLGSFTDAAHHMPSLQAVRHVLGGLDRIVSANGLIMLMDLARLRTAGATERYVQALGRDYVAQGLPDFFDDFRNSMYAAWSVKELRKVVPENSRRRWWHIVPWGLPTIQIILGLPAGRDRLFVRPALAWDDGQNPVPQPMRAEWRLLWWTILFGAKTRITVRRGF